MILTVFESLQPQLLYLLLWSWSRVEFWVSSNFKVSYYHPFYEDSYLFQGVLSKWQRFEIWSRLSSCAFTVKTSINTKIKFKLIHVNENWITFVISIDWGRELFYPTSVPNLSMLNAKLLEFFIKSNPCPILRHLDLHFKSKLSSRET